MRIWGAVPATGALLVVLALLIELLNIMTADFVPDQISALKKESP